MNAAAKPPIAPALVTYNRLDKLKKAVDLIMTIACRRSLVENCGGYSDIYRREDYALRAKSDRFCDE